MVKHLHQPDWLVQHPASNGELRVPGYELDRSVLDGLAPVLLDPHVEQLGRAASQVQVERSRHSWVTGKRVAYLEPTSVLASEVEGYFPSALSGRREAKCSERAASISVATPAVRLR